ncbi:MAG: purine-nucleoside phosphorylase [Candidatus Hydrogenedentota bacterium]|nr:MAG: purine-nucleoside phosphorylase [Candidatus Hydrogenedentota bacterium]
MNKDELSRTLAAAAARIESESPGTPRIAMILGSGLGALGEEVEGTSIDYGDIPGFPVSTVEGHAGKLCLGRLAGQEVAVMSGRFHFYEGYTLQEVTFPVRVLRRIGCEILLVTNAAGGINSEFSVGDLMLITDHINFLGANPLFGPNLDEQGPRFPDMSQAYDRALQNTARTTAHELGIVLREGVYVASMGPSYETAAEIRMYRTMGGDAAGMSTVPEVIVARHAGMRILGLSCITNMAAGILPQPLSHEEVIETTERVKSTFRKLVLGILERL